MLHDEFCKRALSGGRKLPSFLEYYRRGRPNSIEEDPYPSISELKQTADHLTKLTRVFKTKPTKSMNRAFVSREFSNLSETISPLLHEDAPCEHVHMRIVGTAGIIELDRPSKLNSLTMPMIQSISKYVQVALDVAFLDSSRQTHMSSHRHQGQNGE